MHQNGEKRNSAKDQGTTVGRVSARNSAPHLPAGCRDVDLPVRVAEVGVLDGGIVGAGGDLDGAGSAHLVVVAGVGDLLGGRVAVAFVAHRSNYQHAIFDSVLNGGVHRVVGEGSAQAQVDDVAAVQGGLVDGSGDGQVRTTTLDAEHSVVGQSGMRSNSHDLPIGCAHTQKRSDHHLALLFQHFSGDEKKGKEDGRACNGTGHVSAVGVPLGSAINVVAYVVPVDDHFVLEVGVVPVDSGVDDAHQAGLARDRLAPQGWRSGSPAGEEPTNQPTIKQHTQ